MNKEKRTKRSKEKKKAAKKSIYTSRIRELKKIREKAMKGLEDIKKQRTELLDNMTPEEIFNKAKEIEEGTDEEEKKKYKEKVGRLHALNYTENVFKDVLKQAELKINNYIEENL